ncbi:hypothetical protein K503DRAFT_774397 [Rhizopogon vinicolor AM-OR11-026]|uniref:LigT-like protein n=1 Tax=Rhizopogon vinicolor AM-OR11-026 TaxID=1314800 RepID=A0A1B7MPQ1_9AGAM|nr:hypothetical protein K503DRAFT_774397 [Rhizopogon vinicolor AM-OR11-026]
MVHALWLVPSEPERKALKRLMSFRPPSYSSKTHSSRSYPKFDPHITLATFSSSSSLPLAELLPQIVKAPPVYFESIKVGINYLGSLFVDMSRSQELMDLHEDIMGHLKKRKIHAASHSFPHMALFYLHEAVRGERLQLADKLRDSGRVLEQRGITGVALNCALDGAAPEFRAMTDFVGSEIWLVDCTGAVADWKVLEKQKVPQKVQTPSEKQRVLKKKRPVEKEKTEKGKAKTEKVEKEEVPEKPKGSEKRTLAQSSPSIPADDVTSRHSGGGGSAPTASLHSKRRSAPPASILKRQSAPPASLHSKGQSAPPASLHSKGRGAPPASIHSKRQSAPPASIHSKRQSAPPASLHSKRQTAPSQHSSDGATSHSGSKGSASSKQSLALKIVPTTGVIYIYPHKD